MNARHDENERELIRELAKKASEQRQPFILPWRVNPDAKSRRSQVEQAEDAGCGCGAETE
jgi:hypothetical protein